MMRGLAVLVLGVLALPLKAQATDPPVAIVAQAYGTATVQADVQHPAQRAWSLQPLHPHDRLATGPGGKIVVLFLGDQHLEVVDPDTAAQVAFQGLVRSSAQGEVRHPDLGPAPMVPAEVGIPPFLTGGSEPAPARVDTLTLKQEDVALTAWVDLRRQPVFHAPSLGLSAYRFQLFDDKGAFLTEQTSPQPVWRYPHKAGLTKTAVYQWQVLAPDGTVLVPRTPFQVPTSLQARRLAQLEQDPQVPWVRRFLVYQSLGLTDCSLKLARQQSDLDPDNPYLRRSLAYFYRLRGCPAHAQLTLDTAAR